MVRASAPVYVVVRLTWGGRICGNCAMGNPRSDTMPTRTVMIAITIATMGRRMKNEDIRRMLLAAQFLTAVAPVGALDDDAPDPSGAGFGATTAPSLIFWTPSKTMRSPSAT